MVRNLPTQLWGWVPRAVRRLAKDSPVCGDEVANVAEIVIVRVAQQGRQCWIKDRPADRDQIDHTYAPISVLIPAFTCVADPVAIGIGGFGGPQAGAVVSRVGNGIAIRVAGAGQNRDPRLRQLCGVDAVSDDGAAIQGYARVGEPPAREVDPEIRKDCAHGLYAVGAVPDEGLSVRRGVALEAPALENPDNDRTVSGDPSRRSGDIERLEGYRPCAARPPEGIRAKRVQGQRG